MRSLLELSGAVDSQAKFCDDAVDEWLDRALVDLAQVSINTLGHHQRNSSFDYWQAIESDIVRHLSDTSLSPAISAARTAMSVRRLHQTFEGRPRTFAREVRYRRLQWARQLLADPNRSGLRVRDIAAECGFVDLTAFYRAYGSQFGETPGQTRSGDS